MKSIAIAIVGRPNVGKSTLFNRLTRTRDALVADIPGVTRDRKYGEGKVGGAPYIIIDTGGLAGEDSGVESLTANQAALAIQEADHVLFLVDGRAGITPHDETIARQLRQMGKPVTVCVNKTEGMDADLVEADFHPLGFGQPHAISSAHGEGVRYLMEELLQEIAPQEPLLDETGGGDSGIRLAVVGRPNVGKSTLVNRILGEQRVIAYDLPGTTRDSISIPFVRGEQKYTLIDTAGIRRRGRVKEALEKFSIIKALQSIEDANVVLLVLDAREGLTDQDINLLSFILESGRALVICINKWDGLDADVKQTIREELGRRLPFLDYARFHFISALYGSGVGLLYDSIDKAWNSASRKISTPELNKMLADAIQIHQPPLAKGRRIKLRYAHQGGQNPPIIVIHGTQTDQLPDSYIRYLNKSFREWLKLEGTPIRLEFKNSENPYQGIKRKDSRTTRTLEKKRRHTKHLVKKYGGKKDKRKG